MKVEIITVEIYLLSARDREIINMCLGVFLLIDGIRCIYAVESLSVYDYIYAWRITTKKGNNGMERLSKRAFCQKCRNRN